MKKNTLNLSVLLSLFLFAGCGGGSDTQPTNSTSKEIDKSKNVNQSPIATFGNFTINKDTRYDGQLKATDADGDTLKYVIVTQPIHGNVVLHDNGCFTYTPNAGYKGIDTFSYRASDDVSSCAIKTVTVDVNEKDVQKPTAPTDLTVTSLSTTDLRLTWSDNSNNEKGFIIYKDGKPICTTKADVTTFTISCGLEAGTTYNFEVKGQNEAGTSISATASGTTKDVTTKPTPPTELKATAVEKTSLRLAWKDNSDNESSFEIYQDDVKVKTVSSRCACSIITGLKEGTNYNFVVKSVNKLGSADSNNLDVTTKGEIPDEQKTTVAQAVLGPLSKASFKLKRLDTDKVIEEGITTKGNGTNISTVGLIQVSQQTKDDLEAGLYIVEVAGGKDVDADDDKVWDINPTDNNGTLHAIMSGDALKDGNFKVNILSEIIYQSLKDILSLSTTAQIENMIAQKATKLLKNVDNGGDVDGDGDIDNDDVIAWNPADDKQKLRVDYDEKIKPIVDVIYGGGDSGSLLSGVFNRVPVAVAQNIFMSENRSDIYSIGNTIYYIFNTKSTSKTITLEATDLDGDTLSYVIIEQPSHGILTGIAPNLTYTPTKNYLGNDSFTFKANDGTSDSNIVTIDIVINGYRLIEDKSIVSDDTSRGRVRTFTYDINGNVLTDYSKDEVGNVLSSSIYTYDANGNMLTLDSLFPDFMGDNMMHTLINYTYDTNGNMLTASYDDGADETINHIETYTYDTNGNKLTESQDNNADGTMDSIRIYTYKYDTKGNILRKSYDNGADGTTDYIVTYTYDTKGNILTESYDYNGDGILDDSLIYAYDTKGNILRRSHDNGADGTMDYIETYTYDINGNVLTFSPDFDGDGILEYWDETYTYDANGNKLTAVQHRYDGGADSISYFTYDVNGNLLTNSTDVYKDGTINYIETYSWIKL